MCSSYRNEVFILKGRLTTVLDLIHWFTLAEIGAACAIFSLQTLSDRTQEAYETVSPGIRLDRHLDGMGTGNPQSHARSSWCPRRCSRLLRAANCDEYRGRRLVDSRHVVNAEGSSSGRPSRDPRAS